MGFSLMELLVAMVIMAVLVGAGMPGLQHTSERIQVEVWNERLLLLLQQRKAYAMAEGSAVTVAMASLQQLLPKTLALTHNFQPHAPLVFEGESGFARAGSIELTSWSYSTKLIISGLGRIRSCQSQGPRLSGLKPC